MSTCTNALGRKVLCRCAMRTGLFLAICSLIQIVAQRSCHAEAALEIEQRALKQREQITRGHISLVAHLMKLKGDVRTETTLEREFYFDRDRLRCDTTTRSGSNIARIHVSCLHCDSFAHVAWLSGSTGKRNEPQLIIKPSGMEVSKGDFVTPPAELGMIPLPHGMARDFPMDSYLTRADRDSPAVETTSLDGVVSFRIRYTTFNMSKVDEWVSAERGYSVIGIDERFQNQVGAEFHDSMRSTVELHAPSGIWFPVSLDYQRTINGIMFTREQVDISVHSLNTDLDPRVFSLGGIKQLSPGTRIVKYRAEGKIEPDRLEWDGRQIVTNVILKRPPTGLFRSVLFLASLAVFLAFAAFYFIRRYSQSHRVDN